MFIGNFPIDPWSDQKISKMIQDFNFTKKDKNKKFKKQKIKDGEGIERQKSLKHKEFQLMLHQQMKKERH